ncbi:MAG: hypothetical protein LBR80_14670 [Deltaproteobacteria bacterium]|nr:hypothetical protein [Deltaproteobacteria bacterium]
MSGRRGIPVPLLIAGLLLVALILFMAISGRGGGGVSEPPRKASPVVRDNRYGSYSSSALGHEALYEVLSEHRPFVERRLSNAPFPSGPFSAVIIADTAEFLSDSGIGQLDGFEGRALAVLPKWTPRSDRFREDWVRDVTLDESGHYFLALLIHLDEDGYQLEGGPKLTTVESAPDFNYNEIGIVPDFGDRPVQLITGPGIRPVVSSRDGVLVGELIRPGPPRIWIVSDPDLTSNHGIVKGQNLRFALKLIDLWTSDLPRTSEVTFDESHMRLKGEGRGGGIPWRLLRLALSPETGPVLLAFLAALLLFLFGMKRTWPDERTPELSFGKAGLIANTALILERWPMRPELFRRYMDSVVNSAARSLKAPPAARGDRVRLVRWLDARTPSQGPWGLIKLMSEAERELALPAASASRLLYYAGRLHLWKEEAEIGSGTGGKDNGRRTRRGR